MLDREEVLDAYPVGPFDSDSVRPGEGVDVYCITTSPLSDNEQTLTYSNDDYTVLTSQPVVEVITISNLTGGYVHIPNVAYNFNKQIDNPFSGSTTADNTTARIDWVAAWNGTVKTVLTQPNTFTYANSGAPASIQDTTSGAYNNTRVTFTTGNNTGITRTVTGFSYDSESNVATFITNDFLRMKNSEFLGYGKPVINIKNGKMVVNNVPVPRRAYYIPWIASNWNLLKKFLKKSDKYIKIIFFKHSSSRKYS